jgi:ABC-type multidrug transport system ATPase subunit
LIGILNATSGKLTIDGFEAFEDRVELKRRIGSLPDRFSSLSLCAGETLQLSAAMHYRVAKAVVHAVDHKPARR